MPREYCPNPNLSNMADPHIWRIRRAHILAKIVDFLCVAVIYLLSELLIWGLSQTLAPARLEFFATILGMVLMFGLSTIMYSLSKRSTFIYQKWFRGKINFINSHLGMGFTIPMIMLDEHEMLDVRDIGRVIASFITTSLVSWLIVYLLSIAALGVAHLGRQLSFLSTRDYSFSTEKSPSTSSSSVRVSTPNPDRPLNVHDPGQTPSDIEKTILQQSQIIPGEPEQQFSGQSPNVFKFLGEYYPLILSFACIFVIGIPLAATLQEERFMDGFVLWFVWIGAVRLQQAFKTSHACASSPHIKRGWATMMNPVLVTTLLMTAYTRVKATVASADGLAKVLKTLSGGTPLYALWTAKVNNIELPGNPSGWFGAGDAALSILESGMVIWGLKLSECRRQVFSIAGIITIIICTLSAAGNVFLSTLVGRAMGLSAPEALSFAARSTTLALSKPATEAIGGNVVVNATLVVSNGILGQLIYPFALDKLGVSKQNEDMGNPLAQDDIVQDAAVLSDNSQLEAKNPGLWRHECSEYDSPITVAAGIAIGINGAAMGVSYLYEERSRAAPYSALSMAVFGVMTVIFTTVSPFKNLLVGLAGH